MSLLTVIILTAFAVGAFGSIEEGTELNSIDELSASEESFDQIGEWEGRIIGGRDAQPGQFPHQVSLRRVEAAHFCGGSILNRLFILSAAHCTQDHHSVPANIRVVVGAFRRVNDGIVHEVHSIYNHPEYLRVNRSNDISILRTVNNILFDTRYVRPVRLPIFNVPEAGNYTVYVSGWGQISVHPIQPEVLQFKDALTINRQECIALHGINGKFVYENTVCVQNPVGRGACFGDSGGPLITQRGVQVGIVSWGVACARGIPDVYVNVWSHLEWIRATIRANWNQTNLYLSD